MQKMLLTMQKENGFPGFVNSFGAFTQPAEYISHDFGCQKNTASQYQQAQPILQQPNHQQNLRSLNVRPRRRRNCHSVVATMDPVAVARRNERERNRVKQVNDGFNELRKKIPYIPEKKKFSKVEILRFAMTYIRELQGLIEETGKDEVKSSDPSEFEERHTGNERVVEGIFN